MKKLSIIILSSFLAILFLFTGCEPWFGYFDEEMCKDITEIQLIYYDNPEVKKMRGSKERVIPFDFEKMQIVEVMVEERKEEFLADFSTIPCLRDEGAYDSPNGYSLKLNFNNGNFIIVSFVECNYAAIFGADGNILEFYGVSLFQAKYSNPYFNTQLTDRD